MAKMTRLEQIARGKNVADAMVDLRSNKVQNTMRSAIDSAEEAAVEADIKAEDVLNNLYKYAGSSSDLLREFNRYAEYKSVAADYRTTKIYLKELQTRLEEEVEVKEDSK